MAGRPPSCEAPLFGRRLAALRKERNLTQDELAAQLGVKLSLVAYYERRAKNPTLDVANRVAAFFGVPLSSLLDADEPRPRRSKPGPVSELELRIEKLRSLPRSQQELVMRMLDGLFQERQP